MFQVLLPTIREGPRHRYWKWISDAMNAFSASLTHKDVLATKLTLRTVCNFCVGMMLNKYEHVHVKQLFSSISISVLTQCSSSEFADLLCCEELDSFSRSSTVVPSRKAESLVKQLITVVTSPFPATISSMDEDDVSSIIFMHCSVYEILGLAYERYVS